MEKVIIIKCEEIFNGKAHGVEFRDGAGLIRKATAWNDKIDAGVLMQAYASGQEIEVEVQHYTSKAGKEGLNIVGIDTGENQKLYDKYASNSTTMPLMVSEKVIQNAAEESEETMTHYVSGDAKPKANLMSAKDIMIISQCLTKVWGRSAGLQPQEVLDAYRFFVLELEQNG